MKFTLVFLLLIEIPHLKGQQRIYQYGHILLKFEFPPFYNTYHKSCCKLYPSGCYPLLDSTGFATGSLKGRVTKNETNGCIQFQISNAQFVDAGYYRCIVLGTQYPIYRDYIVEVSEVPGQRWPPPAQTTTLKTTYITETQQDPTSPDLAQDDSDSPRVPWSISLMVAAIVSTTALVFITSLITAVCCRIKAKHNQLNKNREVPCDPMKQEEPEVSAIVYTTVDFTAHRKPTEVHTNHGKHIRRAEHAGIVEYSTLAVNQ